MKKNIFGKKGIFYIYISSLILLVVVIIFLVYNKYDFIDKQAVVETRINTINDFLHDIEADSKRVMYVSGFRSLIAIEDYASRSGSYLNNTEELFKIAFYNGTVNGTGVEVMQNSTYSDYLQKLKSVSRRIGVDVFLNVTNITLYHDSPWSVEVVVTAHVYVNDTRGLAYWDFDKNYSTSISLQNIRDPIYSVSTYGKVPNPIRITNISEFVDDTTNSTLSLQYHANNSLYYFNPKAPSFLMRLAGNFSPSPYGIESLVYVPELDTQGVTYDSSKSVVDYIFFTNMTGYSVKACNVGNMPAWFKIDLNHTNTYEINELNYTIC